MSFSLFVFVGLFAGQGDAVVLDGVPAVPPQIAERMTPYLNTRAASLSSLSDAADRLLVLTRFGSTNQAHLVERPLGTRRQLTFFDEPISGAAFVPGKKDALVFVKDKGGDENYQIHRLELTGQTTVMLTDGKSRNINPIWSPDGRRLVWSSNKRNGKDMDLWMSDGATAQSAALFLEREGHWVPVDWSKDGKRLLIMHYVQITDARLWVVDVATKAVTRVSPETPVAADRVSAFGESSDVVYVGSDREGDFLELYRVDLKTGKWTPVSRGIPWDVEDVAMAADKKTVAFTVNEGGYSKLYLHDLKSKKTAPAPNVPRGLIFGLEAAKSRPVLGFSMLGAAAPGDAYTYDLRTRVLERWTESEMGGLDPAALVEGEVIEYETFDGKKIPAFYHRPKGEGPFPVVINIHGGPEAQSRPWFTPTTQYWIVEMGIAVLVPNVRGSAGYGKTYLGLDDGQKREDSVKDIGALLDWIAKQKDLDRDRVAVYGGSYGGYMVLASLAHFGDRLRAGVDIVGISNFVTFLENTSEYRRDLRRVEYGDERDPAMRQFLERISPTNNVAKLKSALFVAQGANDPRVPAKEAEQIVAAVRKTGRPVWYMLAKNEGHGFAKKENRDRFAQITALFFEQQLLQPRAGAAKGAR